MIEKTILLYFRFWTEEHTILFNLEKEQEFSSGSRNQVSKLWRANQSSQKYRNLLFTYRTNKQRANTTTTGTGIEAVKWPYFEIMDSVLGTKASKNPPSIFWSAQFGGGVRGYQQVQPEDNNIEVVDDPQAESSTSQPTVSMPRRNISSLLWAML